MLRKFALHATLVAAMSAAVVTSFADDRYSAQGSGEFREGDSTNRIDEATVELRDNDHFILTLRMHDGGSQELRGVFKGSGQHRDLVIRKGLGKDELTGWGEIELGDNNSLIRSVTIHGSFNNGKPYSVEFKRQRESYSQRNTYDDFSFSETVTGSGRLHRFGQHEDVNQMRVRMSSNGDLNLRIDGMTSGTLSLDGRWSGQGPVYDIEIRPSRNYQVRAKGKLTLSRNLKAFKEIALEGSDGGEDFEVRFSKASTGDIDTEDRFSLTDSIGGSGTLAVGEYGNRITRARVHMSSNGDLEIHLEGPDINDTELTGRWSGSGSECSIEITNFGDSRAKATGVMFLSPNRRHVQSIELNGRRQGMNMTLNFVAD